MASLSDAERRFVRENPYYGILTTIRPDGSPHSTVVWVDEEEGEIVFNTARGRAKERYVNRNPEVGVIVVNPSDGYQWLSVSGPVRLESEGAREMINKLSHKYDGKDYPAERLEREERVTGRIRPRRAESRGLDS
jgi:PPOX class probable F420-dependent enzyme